MRPLDPRLMKYAKAARSAIALNVVYGILQSVLVIAQIYVLALLISPLVNDGTTPADSVGPIENLSIHSNVPIDWDTVGKWSLVFIAIALFRVFLNWLRARTQQKAAKNTIRQLRYAVLTHAINLGPRWLGRKGTDTTTLVTSGLDKLRPYFTDYLPQLFLSVTVTPIALACLTWVDLTSAIIAFVTIPLIPIFMILVGVMTRDTSERKIATMQQLGRQLLDLVAGLPTLKILGRAKGPEKQIDRIGKTYTQTTMATLRIAFLSGAVLEFISVLSVALVAVTVGVRMVEGSVSLKVGLIAIMLAPEIYAPLREVGKHFHASADGLAAANAAFEIIEETPEVQGTEQAPDLRECEIEVRGLWVAARTNWAPGDLSFTLRPGQVSALIGSSGAGKTTTAMVLLKQLLPTRGEVSVGGQNITDINPESWWAQATWLPQSPALLPGTLAENVADTPELIARYFPAGQATADVHEAARISGFDEVLEQLTDGWNTRLQFGGEGLSVGQRQRLALVRALLSPRQLIVLDEPTAHLDAQLVAQVCEVISQLKKAGKTVLVIAHRPELAALADQVIEVSPRFYSSKEAQQYAPREVEAAKAQVAEEPTFLGERARVSTLRDMQELDELEELEALNVPDKQSVPDKQNEQNVPEALNAPRSAGQVEGGR